MAYWYMGPLLICTMDYYKPGYSTESKDRQLVKPRKSVSTELILTPASNLLLTYEWLQSPYKFCTDCRSVVQAIIIIIMVVLTLSAWFIDLGLLIIQLRVHIIYMHVTYRGFMDSLQSIRINGMHKYIIDILQLSICGVFQVAHH